MTKRTWTVVTMVLAITLMVVGGSLMAFGTDAEPNADEEAILAPDFTLKSLDGESYTLSDLRGKVVVVNFWATWCGPCRKEIPDLSRIYSAYKEQDVVILGISLDDVSTDKVRKFAENYKITYPILHGTRSELMRISRTYGGVTAIPTTFLIDREGYIQDMFLGARSEQFFLDRIRALL